MVPPFSLPSSPRKEMKEHIVKKGFGFALRPVREADAEFILRLRAMPHGLGIVGTTVPDLGSQLRWMRDYFCREDDHYFIIESMQGVPVGTVGLYNIRSDSAEWGRWIIVPGVAAAVPSAVMIHQLAFEDFGLRRVRACVVATNVKVLSFHAKFGARVTSIEKGAGRRISGSDVDLVWHIIESETWIQRRDHLVSLAQIVGVSLSGSSHP